MFVIKSKGNFDEVLVPTPPKDWHWMRGGLVPPKCSLLNLKTAREYAKAYIRRYSDFNLTVKIVYIK